MRMEIYVEHGCRCGKGERGLTEIFDRLITGLHYNLIIERLFGSLI